MPSEIYAENAELFGCADKGFVLSYDEIVACSVNAKSIFCFNDCNGG
tara:strand:+ start:800 stop:940 length:141 start_codon:yes stop_codon:yes gene_type:complete